MLNIRKTNQIVDSCIKVTCAAFTNLIMLSGYYYIYFIGITELIAVTAVYCRHSRGNNGLILSLCCHSNGQISSLDVHFLFSVCPSYPRTSSSPSPSFLACHLGNKNPLFRGIPHMYTGYFTSFTGKIKLLSCTQRNLANTT